MKRPLIVAAVALLLGELSVVHKIIVFICIFAVLMHIGLRYKQNRCKWLGLAELVLFGTAYCIGYGQLFHQIQVYGQYETIADDEAVEIIGTIEGIKPRKQGTQLDVKVLSCCISQGAKKMPDGVILRILAEEAEYLIGQKIHVEGRFVPLELPRNTGNFNERQYYYGEGIAGKAESTKIRFLDDGCNELRNWLSNLQQILCKNVEQLCASEEASVLKAILFGEKNTLDEDVKALYQKSGIAHILAISGVCTLSLVSLRPP